MVVSDATGSETESELELPWMRRGPRAVRRAPHLVLVWSLDEPERLGEALPIRRPVCIGRGGPQGDDPVPRATPQWMRPSRTVARPPIASARISRRHLLMEPDGAEGVRVRVVGKAPVRIAGQLTLEGVAHAGDLISIQNAALYLVAIRPVEFPALAAGTTVEFPFAAPDPFGMVGESEAAWRVREAISFAASTDKHVLILGESGTGKELAARAVHGLSERRRQGFVARNAATMPESLIDAELFGNVKNYPNPGMPERPGLIGEADGSTLFLDEIGDLPERCQVHLLRALDSDGEYQRLGEARPRRSSFRLVAATNRPPTSLKHDFLARFTHRIALPGLSERREDIPLVLAEILRQTAHKNRHIAARFFEMRAGAVAEPRLDPDLVARLLQHPFTHHVRELERLVWLAISTAEGDYIGLTPDVERELRDQVQPPAAETDGFDRETLARALAENGRSPTRAAKALGLKNRFVLHRLLKKHGLTASSDEDGEGGGT